MSKKIFRQPREKNVRYALFDFDSGLVLGDLQTLTVEVFTDNLTEVYCRLKDYLTYHEGMIFEHDEIKDFARHKFEDELFNGECYCVNAAWHDKPFGILFNCDDFL